jgi:YbbR domain-containing protein
MNLTAKIVGVVFAIILWFNVTTNSVFNHKVSLPIQYVGLSEGYVITSSLPDEVLANIKGSGRDLVTFYLQGLSQTLKSSTIVHLTGIPEGKNPISITKSSIVGLPSGVEVEGILYPDNGAFSIEIDRKIKRTIAVEIDSLSGYRVVEGYCIVGKPVSTPEFVLVQGPEKVLNNINSLKINFLADETVSQSDTVLTSHLEVPPLVTVEPDRVDIHFRVEPLVTRQVARVPLTLKGFQRRNHPEFEPDTVAVHIYGPESVVSGIEKENILVAIRYDTYIEHLARGDSLITPTTTIPESASVVSIVPKAIRFK